MRNLAVIVIVLFVVAGIFFIGIGQEDELISPELQEEVVKDEALQPSIEVATDAENDASDELAESENSPMNTVGENTPEVNGEPPLTESTFLQPFSMPEAAAKFIPKEERKPGNLGGPPPFEWPPRDLNEQ